MGRNYEAVSRQAKEIEGKDKKEDVNKIKSKTGAKPKSMPWMSQNKKGRLPTSGASGDTTSKRGSEGTRSCFACGGRWHAGGREKCPAFGKSCHNSGRRNHFANLCKNTRKAKSKVHQVDETQVETESDDYTEYTMFNLKLSSKEGVFSENKDDPYMISLNIEDTEIEMEIDTGSRCTVINKLTFDRLCGKATLLNTRKRLTTYLGEEIPVKGHAKVNVSHNNQN